MRCHIEEESVGLDMTPMIDCVFLLLIFFLVATTMKKIDRELPIRLPPSQTAVEVQQPDDHHVIAVSEKGELFFDGVATGIGLLQRNIRDLAATNPDSKIRLDIDRDARFNDAIMVLDMLRFERMTNIAINTRKKDERGY